MSRSGPTLSAPDQLTVVFEFDSPNGLFLHSLAMIDGANVMNTPKHFCSQFDPEYNLDVDALAEKEGYENWSLMMVDRCPAAVVLPRWAHTDLPVVQAWHVTQPAKGNATQVVLECPVSTPLRQFGFNG